MSLNRAQWESMWDCVKKIEREAKTLHNDIVRQRILNQVDWIKSLIQSVIGQME